MPTAYSDYAYPTDAYQLATPVRLVPQAVTVTDQNDDGLIDVNDTIDGVDILAVYNGDTITVGGTVIQGVSVYLQGGETRFLALDGSVLDDGWASESTWVSASSSFAVGGLFPPCFVAGTRIACPSGLRAVESLRIGDRVMTADDGPQPVRWIGRTRVRGTGRFAPIRIRAGRFGAARDLFVSQQHRILVRERYMDLLFGEGEMLAPARALVNGADVSFAPSAHVEYVHLFFDRHQVIFSENALTESFHPGDQITSMDHALRTELFGLFPDLALPDRRERITTARPVMRGGEARLLRRKPAPVAERVRVA